MNTQPTLSAHGLVKRYGRVTAIDGAEFVYIAGQLATNREGAIIGAALDNLTKGASGQAVQNMNLMLGFPETLGLEQVALFP